MYILIALILTFIIVPFMITAISLIWYRQIKNELSPNNIKFWSAKKLKPFKLKTDYLFILFLIIINLTLLILCSIFIYFIFDLYESSDYIDIIIFFGSILINCSLIGFFVYKSLRFLKNFNSLNKDNNELLTILEQLKNNNSDYKKIEIKSNNSKVFGMSSSIKFTEKYWEKWNSSSNNYSKCKFFILYTRRWNFGIKRITNITNANIYIDGELASIEQLENQVIQNFVSKINL